MIVGILYDVIIFKVFLGLIEIKYLFFFGLVVNGYRFFDFYGFVGNFKSDNIIWNVDYYDVFLYNYYVWVDILFIY